MTQTPSERHDVIALIPAAGSGSRLGMIPGSKEVFPIGFQPGDSGQPKVKVVSQYLFERLAAAGVARGIVIFRAGKWDIPAFFGEGEPAGMKLGYVVVGETLGPPDTLDRAYDFVKSNTVAFGFPDILLGPTDVYSRLLARLDEGNVDAVLGLYDPLDPAKSDLVDLDDQGWVRAMVLKDPDCAWPHCWGCAVWRPTFTEYMRSHVQRAREAQQSYEGVDAGGDLPMGLVIQDAVKDGLRVAGVPFPGESWVDVGNPEDLVRVTASLRTL